MLNVLLVEDELIVRKGLKAMIDWEQYNMNVAYEATNGEDALQIVHNHSVDVVITDIRMPLMNGIELTRLVKETFPQIKVMLLTCYNDFEYVQEALELGASCYLLKTDLEDGSIEKQLQKIAHEVNEERLNRKAYAELERKAEQTSTFFLENQIKTMLKDGEQTALRKDELRWLLSPHLMMKMFVHENSFPVEMVKRIIEKIVDRPFFVFSIEKGAIFALLSVSDDEWSDKDRIEWMKQMIDKLTEECLKQADLVSVYYTICQHGNVLKQTYELLSEKARKHFFYNGYRHSINILRIPPRQSATFRPLPLQTLHELTILRNWAKVKEICESLFRYYEENEFDEDIVKVNVVTIVETIMYGLQSNSHLFTSNWGSNSLDFKERVKEITFFKEVKQWFFQGLDQLEESRVLFSGGVNQVVKHAIAYIEMNYAEEITLEELSKEVGLSKSYLSTMFKKETGRNIVEYVNDLRIKKAKELILKSDLRIFEVAERIGFKDPKYFSKQFKRSVGVSPNDYKNQLNQIV